MKGAACLALLQVITYMPSRSAKYVGGTVSEIPGGVLGDLSSKDEKVLSFEWAKKGKAGSGQWKVAYNKVTALSYGQHAGRRVGGAIGAGVATLGVGAVPMLLVKKRRHYLTIEFLDEKGKSQAAIFLVGKGAIRPALDTLEARTGKKVQYEDEEARKSREK